MSVARLTTEVRNALFTRLFAWVLSLAVATMLSVNVASLTRERIIPLVWWSPASQCGITLGALSFPYMNAHVLPGDFVSLTPVGPEDLIDFESRTNLLLPSGGSGDRIHFSVPRGEGALRFNTPVDLVSPRWLSERSSIAPDRDANVVWHKPLEGLGFCLLGLFVAWRATQRWPAWLLAIFCVGFGASQLPWYSVLPSTGRLAFFAFLSIVCCAGSLLSLYVFLSFAFRSAKRDRMIVSRVLAVAGMALSCIWPLSLTNAAYTGCFVPSEQLFASFGAVLPNTPRLALLCLLAAVWMAARTYRHADADTKDRFRWIHRSTLWFTALLFAGGVFELSDHALGTVEPYTAISFLLMLGLLVAYTYAIMFERPIPVQLSFPKLVANVVVGLTLTAIFTWLEEGAIRYLEGQNFPEIFAVQFALIGTTGILFSLAHRRVDEAVEKVMFKERLEARHRFVEFLRATNYSQDDQDVIDQSAGMIESGLGARYAVTYLMGAAGLCETSPGRHTVFPDTIPAGDPLILRLRARTRPIRLSDVPETALGAHGFVAPIVRHNMLLGAIAYAERVDAIPYSEDDHQLILMLAQQLALILDDDRGIAKRRLEPVPAAAPAGEQT